MDWLIFYYLGFIFVYRLTQFYAIIKAKNLYKPDHAGDWAVFLVWVPLVGALIAAPYQYFLHREQPAPVLIMLGSIFFTLAIVIRGKSLADLSREFFVFANKKAKFQLVKGGIYSQIRHPLYLANILLMIAGGLFFASIPALIISLAGVIGVHIKINLEEKIMAKTFDHFSVYRHQTARLLPKIY